MVAEMEAKKYGKALGSESAPNPTPSTPINPPPPQAEADQSAPPATGDHDFDYSQTMSASKFNVQVRIGPSGETVVDEESLYVDNNAEQDTHDYTHVEESDTTKFVNSATHSRKLRGSRWSTMETELFYDVRSFPILHFKWSAENSDQALSQFGENYELISYVLPGRDRKACKNKFKAEDKRDPARIDHYLKNRIPYGV
jgi:transcription factor TFIIIB component B''